MSIQLTKGQTISLIKEDKAKLENFCVGASWGAKKAKGFLGGAMKAASLLGVNDPNAVDLDLSVALLTESKQFVNAVYHANLELPGIVHSGDNRTGDQELDDNDNEVISIVLKDIPDEIHYMTMVLNCYNEVDFKDIPFASMRLYEGTPDVVHKEFAKFRIDNNSEFAGSKGMVLGALFRKNGDWEFKSIGLPTKDHDLQKIIEKSMELI